MESGMRTVLLFTTLCACSDYVVTKRSSDESPADDVVAEDTASPPPATVPEDTAPPEDTADSGINEDPPEDTGDDSVDAPVEPVYVHTANTLYSWEPSTGHLTLVGDFHDSTGGAYYGSMTDIAIDSTGNFYGVSFSGLYGIDPATAMVWEIASLDMSFVGLTATSDGRLIGAGEGLYEIDTTTGETTVLVEPGRYNTSGDIVGLPDSLLYWLVESPGGLADDLIQVDPDSGATSFIGNVGMLEMFGVGYADGFLYGFSASGRVVEIDPSTGASVSVSFLAGSWWGAATNPVLWSE
jgi:hypothetical protein